LFEELALQLISF